jgi:hypothetical protein
MKSLLAILAVFLFIHQSLADECASGANFWCSSLENAQSCDKEQYCNENCWSYSGRVQEFWRNQMMKFNRLPNHSYTLMCTNANQQLSVRSTACKGCKVVIGDLDKLLKSKMSLESVLTAMRFFCNFLPAYSTLCREVVTDIGSMIGSLEPYLSDPELACEKIKMCPKPGDNSTIPHLFTLIAQAYSIDKLAENRIGNSTICDDCQKACGDIIAQMEDPAQQENIKETFEELCDYVGPLKHKCIEYIDEFVPQLINWIISRFTDPLGLCTQLGFCK